MEGLFVSSMRDHPLFFLRALSHDSKIVLKFLKSSKIVFILLWFWQGQKCTTYILPLNLISKKKGIMNYLESINRNCIKKQLIVNKTYKKTHSLPQTALRFPYYRGFNSCYGKLPPPPCRRSPLPRRKLIGDQCRQEALSCLTAAIHINIWCASVDRAVVLWTNAKSGKRRLEKQV